MKKKLKRRGKFWVYIVECADGAYYTGYTNDLEKRLKEHNDGKRGAWYTRYKRPLRLVWQKEYRYFRKAADREREIKKLTHKEKEEFIRINEKNK